MKGDVIVSVNRDRNFAVNVDWIDRELNDGEKFNDAEKLCVKQSINMLLQTARKENWDDEGV